MKVYSINLYEYFGLNKPENAKGDLTVYIPTVSPEVNAERKCPMMLVLPGGGYAYTSPREAEPVCLAYIRYGFASCYLDYSCAPARHPYPLAEAVMAMNYLRLNAEELHIDPEMISAIGFSAGGHLCGTLATMYDCEDIKKVFESKVSSRPNAVVLGYPVITSMGKGHIGSFKNLCGEDEELIAKLSVEKAVNKNSSPAFIWATYTDGIVPVKNSLLIANAYEDAEVPFSLHIYGKGQHGLSVCDMTVYGNHEPIDEASTSVPEWVRLSVEWLEEQGISVK